MTDYNMDVWIERDNAVIDIRDSETEQNSVFTIENAEDLLELIDLGYLNDHSDFEGMEEYLKMVGIFSKDDQIVAVT